MHKQQVGTVELAQCDTTDYGFASNCEYLYTRKNVYHLIKHRAAVPLRKNWQAPGPDVTVNYLEKTDSDRHVTQVPFSPPCSGGVPVV